jgi:hypothetical protein
MFRKLINCLVLACYLPMALSSGLSANPHSCASSSENDGGYQSSSRPVSPTMSENGYSDSLSEGDEDVYSDTERNISYTPPLVLKSPRYSSNKDEDWVIDMNKPEEDTIPATTSQSDSPNVSATDSEEDEEITHSQKPKKWYNRGGYFSFANAVTFVMAGMTQWCVKALTDFVVFEDIFTDDMYYSLPAITAIFDAPSSLMQYKNWFKEGNQDISVSHERSRTNLQSIVHFLCPYFFQLESDHRKPGVTETLSLYMLIIVSALNAFSPLFQMNQFYWENWEGSNQVEYVTIGIVISSFLFVRNFENAFKSGLTPLQKIVNKITLKKYKTDLKGPISDLPKKSLLNKLTGNSEDPKIRRFLGTISLLTGPAASFANYMIGSHVMHKCLTFLGFEPESTLIQGLPVVSGIFSMAFRGGLETIATKKNFHNFYDYMTASHKNNDGHGKLWAISRGGLEIFSFVFGSWEAASLILLGTQAMSDYPLWVRVAALVPLAIGEGAIQGNRNSSNYDQIIEHFSKKTKN